MSLILSPRFLINKAKPWLGTGACFGASAALVFLYITDWKLINQYIPIYNTKFKTEDDE